MRGRSASGPRAPPCRRAPPAACFRWRRRWGEVQPRARPIRRPVPSCYRRLPVQMAITPHALLPACRLIGVFPPRAYTSIAETSFAFMYWSMSTPDAGVFPDRLLIDGAFDDDDMLHPPAGHNTLPSSSMVMKHVPLTLSTVACAIAHAGE